jgi:hypothetical protein
VDGGDRPAQGVVAAPGQQVNLQLHQIGQLDQQLGADLRSHVGEGLVDEGPHARGGLGVGGIAQHRGGRLHRHAAGPPVGAPGWIWAQWGQRDAGDGAPVQLAGPGRGATEPLPDPSPLVPARHRPWPASRWWQIPVALAGPTHGRMVLGGDRCRQPSCRGSPPAPWCHRVSKRVDTGAWAVPDTRREDCSRPGRSAA